MITKDNLSQCIYDKPLNDYCSLCNKWWKYICQSYQMTISRKIWISVHLPGLLQIFSDAKIGNYCYFAKFFKLTKGTKNRKKYFLMLNTSLNFIRDKQIINIHNKAFDLYCFRLWHSLCLQHGGTWLRHIWSLSQSPDMCCLYSRWSFVSHGW